MVHGMIFVIRSSSYHINVCLNVLLVPYMHRSDFEKKRFDFKVVWMLSGDIKFVVAKDTERSGDDILQAYAISISYVVRLSSSRRLPLLTLWIVQAMDQ